MRIGVWYNLPSGGSKRALFDHLQGLKKRGHHIEAWRPPLIHEKFSSIGSLVEEHELPLDVLPEGKGYLDRIVRHVLRSRRLLASMKEHCEKAAKQIEGGGFDVLFANTDMYFSMPFVARFTEMPTAVFLGEPRRLFYEAFPEFLWKALPEETSKSWRPKSLIKRIRDNLDIAEYRIEAREEYRNACAFDKILVNSIYSQESVFRAYGLPSEVCYLGIDQKRFKPLGLPRERFAVGMGTVAHTKNLLLAVETVAKLPEPKPPLVWIANMADDVYLTEVREVANRLGVDFRLKYHIPDEEVLDLLNRATLMLYTSRLEPFGLAPLEANACGTPVVAVRQGGMRETVVPGLNGLLGSENPEELAEAAATLLSDPGLADQIGKQAIEWVTNEWSMESGIDRIERALHSTARR